MTKQLAADVERREWDHGKAELVEITADGAISKAADVYSEWETDAPFYTIMRGMFPDICPTSVVSEDVHFWISMEGQVKDYGIPPFTGGLMEQPTKVLQLLNTVRSTKNQWEVLNMPKPGSGK